MKINNKNLSQFKATYLGVQFPIVDVYVSENWLSSSAKPQIYRTKPLYTTLDLRLLIEGSTPKEMSENRSNIMKEMLSAQLDFTSELGIIFDGFYDSHTETIINGTASEITYRIKGVKYGDVKTIGVGSSLIDGNTITQPSSIVFTASSNGTAVLNINADSYVLNLEGGATYQIDGMNGVIKKNGAIDMGCYESLSFPILYGGVVNTITMTNVTNLAITYNGRWI